MPGIDFVAVKSAISVRDLLARWNWQPTRKEPASWRGPCPLHGSKPGSRSFSCTARAWYCHGRCSCGGDVITLWLALTPHQGGGLTAAVRALCEYMGISVPYLRRPSRAGQRNKEEAR
jgi:hypothetical protein